MKLLGNILWFLCGGIIGGLAWIIAGCIWCVTIVGIPVGLHASNLHPQHFGLFGKEVVYGNGTFSFLVEFNLDFFSLDWGMALGNIVLGCMWCITIVGIPFGKQFFKMARLSFMPFGANVLQNNLLYKEQSGKNGSEICRQRHCQRYDRINKMPGSQSQNFYEFSLSFKIYCQTPENERKCHVGFYGKSGIFLIHIWGEQRGAEYKKLSAVRNKMEKNGFVQKLAVRCYYVQK